MQVPANIDYVWSALLKNGRVVENFIERDGVLVDVPFWLMRPKDVKRLFVSSANGTRRLYQFDVEDLDKRAIWFRHHTIRVLPDDVRVHFIEYCFGIRTVSTNGKAVVWIDKGDEEGYRDDDGRAYLDKIQEEKFIFGGGLRLKRWLKRRKFQRRYHIRLS
jgi:hypothetical protein